MIKFILFPLIAFVLVGITNELTINEDIFIYISFTISTILAYKFSTKNRLTLASIYSIFLIFISFFIQLLSSNEDVVLAIIASLIGIGICYIFDRKVSITISTRD